MRNTQSKKNKKEQRNPQTSGNENRRHEIMDVAVALLATHGYRDTTMLQIAQRAGASKETLYAWFGDKPGLFEAIIQRNAKKVQTVLARHLEGDASTERVLREFGNALLSMLISESAVAINRAAISEVHSDPALARALVHSGREATLPGLVRLLDQRRRQGELKMKSASQAAENFLGLLLGDLQVRRLLGVLPEPTTRQIKARATQATQHFLHLYD